MKNLLILITIMLVGGCISAPTPIGHSEQRRLQAAARLETKRLSQAEAKRIETVRIQPEPYQKIVKSVLGTYKRTIGMGPKVHKFGLQENGETSPRLLISLVRPNHSWPKYTSFLPPLHYPIVTWQEWKIVGGNMLSQEIHVSTEIEILYGLRDYHIVYVFRINKDDSLTWIANIDKDGKRTTRAANRPRLTANGGFKSFTWKKSNYLKQENK